MRRRNKRSRGGVKGGGGGQGIRRGGIGGGAKVCLLQHVVIKSNLILSDCIFLAISLVMWAYPKPIKLVMTLKETETGTVLSSGGCDRCSLALGQGAYTREIHYRGNGSHTCKIHFGCN